MYEHAPIIFAIPFLIYSIILHEIAHGWVAERFGDPTARDKGRITLNPIPHIDPFMTIILPAVLLFMTGGRAVFGGAKPVPVDLSRVRPRRVGDILLTAAGPATNVAVAVFFAVLLNVRVLVPLDSVLYHALTIVVTMNVFLAAFNLLPIPPLDGSHILAAIFPNTIGRLIEGISFHFGLIVSFVV